MDVKEKAKAYDEALKVLHKYDGVNIVFTQDLKEEMFPELKESKESKDEKLREQVVYAIDQLHVCECTKDKLKSWLEKQGKNNMGISEATKQELEDNLHKALEKETPESWNEFLEKQGESKLVSKMQVSEELYEHIRIACACIDDALSSKTLADIKDYLIMADHSAKSAFDMVEKQGEQKPADKVGHKFKDGDWVTSDGESVFRITIDNNKYQLETLEGMSCHYSYEIIERKFRLWTIQDAKDGDILSYDNGKWIFIVKNIEDISVNYYVLLYDKKELTFNCGGETTLIETIVPATKEQSDLLFQKMHEAGYEWDAEKKELKKIEQSPANVFNIHKKSLLEKFKQAVYDCAWGKVTCKKEGESKEEYANRWAEHFLLMVRDWADDYIDFTIQQKLRKSYDKGKENAIKENRPSWGEEDEDILNTIINHFKVDIECTDEDDTVRWLKSIKDRVQSQYLTVTDEELAQAKKDAYNYVLDKIEYNSENPTFDDGWSAAIWYLKKRTAQPQSTWKPSDEQIDCLSDAVARYNREGFSAETLTSLLEQLKKLKEE